MQRDPAHLTAVAARLDALHDDLLRATGHAGAAVADAHPDNRGSAQNLAQYVELRQHDIRPLQESLAELGLSSLGRTEPHVLATLEAVRVALARLAGLPDPVVVDPPVDFVTGPELLAQNADDLLGTARNRRRTRIMVTLPTEAATDPGLADRVVAAGAEVVRINCAHDGPEAWSAMIRNVRRAERAHGRRVAVTMDLAGPKLRTGPIQPGPQVLKVRPVRDALGRTVEPARLRLTAEIPDAAAAASATATEPAAEEPAADGPARLPVVAVADQAWLRGLAEGDAVRLRDARGRRRRLRVVGVAGPDRIVEVDRTVYFTPGIRLRSGGETTRVGALPATEQRLLLHPGDVLTLVPSLEPVPVDAGRIGCTLPQVFRDAAHGHRIMFDDGKVSGRIEHVSPGAVRVRITEADGGAVKLGAAKGINLPDTDLRLPALTDADLSYLPFVVEHADAVSLSFVRGADDVLLLQRHLTDLGGNELGLILKIETVAGFERLPDILFAAMRWPRVGVMIARGDLAVEAGYRRLAELQEEMLWLCEAAHVPVIWATQVLDTLARTGRPSRAEVTDAAMSGRAECVMLNKGPWVGAAVEALDDILGRMDDHQRKKQSLLRRLTSWEA
ncbi:pyruvate kinase [Agromyces bauzanensis]|uniref:pyruvate kinase n=1 Tax=Agromyces bauzanensis TaxID=1308924 RepID=A0A917PJ59_9MICO|nr:pyruvate kinase [Agromyces bauzanensis]GGJ81525.1 pyruvate kinase [Agromyces bauzanensis]